MAHTGFELITLKSWIRSSTAELQVPHIFLFFCPDQNKNITKNKQTNKHTNNKKSLKICSQCVRSLISPRHWRQLQMLLFPNTLCCSLYERNCAVTKIFTKFLPADTFCQLLWVTRKHSCNSAGNAQAQLHFRDDQQRAFGISNISSCCECPIHFMHFACLLTATLSTHPDSSDQLCRSHKTKYRWGYCKLEYRWGYFEGTLQLLWQKNPVCRSCSIPSTVPSIQLTVASAVTWDLGSRLGGIWGNHPQIQHAASPTLF